MPRPAIGRGFFVLPAGLFCAWRLTFEAERDRSVVQNDAAGTYLNRSIFGADTDGLGERLVVPSHL